MQFRFSTFNFLNHPLPTFGASGQSDIQLNFNNNGNLSQTNLNKLTNGFPRYTTAAASSSSRSSTTSSLRKRLYKPRGTASVAPLF